MNPGSCAGCAARSPRRWTAQVFEDRQPQHDFCAWIGGHFTEPNEQKTQQSPGFGRSKVLHAAHS
jgi:hypothetical protein